MQLQKLHCTRKDRSYIRALIEQAPLDTLTNFTSESMLLACKTLKNDKCMYMVLNGKFNLGWTNDSNIAFQWLHNGSLFTQKELKTIAITGWQS